MSVIDIEHQVTCAKCKGKTLACDTVKCAEGDRVISICLDCADAEITDVQEEVTRDLVIVMMNEIDRISGLARFGSDEVLDALWRMDMARENAEALDAAAGFVSGIRKELARRRDEIENNPF